MKDKAQEIYNKLPSSWEEVTVEKFMKISVIEIAEKSDFENLTADLGYISKMNLYFQELSDDERKQILAGADFNLKTISVLTDVTEVELKTLHPYEIAKLIGKLEFMDVAPVPNKEGSIQFKLPDEITYDNFLQFIQFENDFFNNLHLLIPAFSKTQIEPENVLKMSIVDAHTCFFLHRKALRKLTYRTIFFLWIKLIKQTVKERFRKIIGQPK